MASIVRTALPPDIDPAGFAHVARSERAVRACAPDVHSLALALDPATWESVRFTLWCGSAKVEETERYKLLHLSSPHMSDLLPSRDIA